MRTFIILLTATLLLTACGKSDNALEHAKKHLDSKYLCPMHPQIVRNEPSNCPICGMMLVKKEIQPAPPKMAPKKHAEKDKHPTITIRPEIIQNMGLRTTKVKKGNLQKYIKTVGYVAYNEDKLVHVHPRSTGWVEKLYMRRESETIKRGQSLLEMYSPEILEAQQDFLVALRSGSKGTSINRQQYRNAIRNRLRLLGVPDSIIKKIERQNKSINKVPIFAPQSGTVIGLNIRQGMYVTPSLEMFTIVDLSTIWVMVEVFEHQLDWIQTGLSAKIRVPALPGRVWKGKVDYIYPELEPKTRTLKVRLGFDNPKGQLKLNMFAQAEIHGKPKGEVLKIPRQALIVTGERESVIVALGDGRFKPVDVKTGMRSQGEVEILSGLKKDERIVLSGQFLIDSEANLQASFLRFSGGGHQH
ncbi:RND transporter [Candidatus Thiomargarita nelsonii]|uniref:RND transporter n=1 Tax=Candidatus Thiomargarita nelsonii TaxID=1003181 RepID=A0A0A6PLN0_9GAMM|nr:RND transporter [Candidatus Thiomargarita nelsonii]